MGTDGTDATATACLIGSWSAKDTGSSGPVCSKAFVCVIQVVVMDANEHNNTGLPCMICMSGSEPSGRLLNSCMP